MKRRNPHNVYLSRQAMDIFIAFKTCSGGSRFVLPNRYDINRPMSGVSLNGVLSAVVEAANSAGVVLDHFSPHDLRGTGSTIAREVFQIIRKRHNEINSEQIATLRLEGRPGQSVQQLRLARLFGRAQPATEHQPTRELS